METAVQATLDTVHSITGGPYKYGFVTDIESDMAPKGLNEEVIRFISAKKGEPDWLLVWRLKAYRHWLTMCCRTIPSRSRAWHWRRHRLALSGRRQ